MKKYPLSLILGMVAVVSSLLVIVLGGTWFGMACLLMGLVSLFAKPRVVVREVPAPAAPVAVGAWPWAPPGPVHPAPRPVEPEPVQPENESEPWQVQREPEPEPEVVAPARWVPDVVPVPAVSAVDLPPSQRKAIEEWVDGRRFTVERVGNLTGFDDAGLSDAGDLYAKFLKGQLSERLANQFSADLFNLVSLYSSSEPAPGSLIPRGELMRSGPLDKAVVLVRLDDYGHVDWPKGNFRVGNTLALLKLMAERGDLVRVEAPEEGDPDRVEVRFRSRKK